MRMAVAAVKEEQSMAGISTKVLASVVVALIGCCSEATLAVNIIPDALALQESFWIWPSSTVPSGKKVSGETSTV